MAPESAAQPLEQVGVQFMSHRPKMYAIAVRALGSTWSADDAVQEAWMRLQRAEPGAIKNLEAWLTTVISRVCIDLIRRQASRPEDLDRESADQTESAVPGPVDEDPLASAMLADDVAVAMQVVLDALGPLERLAVVLHDIFGLSFEDIGPIVERTPAAARQLASRARARLRTVDTTAVRARQNDAIQAFLGAARSGDFGGLLQLLDPDIELRSDAAAVELAVGGTEHGAPLLDSSVRSADAVARVFAGRADQARLVRIHGVPAAAYVADGIARAVYLMTFDAGRIARVDVVAERATLSSLNLVL